MFRRRKGADDREPDQVDEDLDPAAADEDAPVASRRPAGPWDVDEAPDDGVTRLDLGGLRVPGFEGMEIQVNLDEATGNLIAVTAVIGDSALQLQPFAAPRGEGIWSEVRREIAADITRDGGLADVLDDDPELEAYLLAQLPFPQPDGSSALRAVRFIGVDGPRWFLRGVLTGSAAVDPAAAAALMAVFRGCVVVRGGDPLAPRDPITLRLPTDATPVADPGARTLDDLDPGPTITEIR